MLTSPHRTITLWLILFLLVGVHGQAQNITLSVKNAPLLDVFKKIEKQSGYTFFYNTEWLSSTRPVTLTLKNAPFRAALDSCFKGQPLQYALVNRTVVTSKIKTTAIDESSLVSKTPAPLDEISGTVYDSTFAPLADATVLVKGSQRGTNTNVQGKFSFKRMPRDSTVVLVISYTGLQTMEFRVPREQKSGNIIVLRPTQDQMDQVQVIAYGSSIRRYDVGSVSVVTSREIEMQPVSNPLDALKGKVPGLEVTSTNGAPGAMVLTQIRGQNTLNPNATVGAGNRNPISLSQYNQPLYVIDGVPFAAQNNDLSLFGQTNTIFGNPMQGKDAGINNNQYGGISPMNSINPLDIESISVLKDADATAIYGSRGSNGVILITTKRGKPGRISLNMSLNTGPTNAARHVRMMNSSQYLQMRHEALKNDGLAPSIDPVTSQSDYDLLLYDTTKSTNYYQQLLGKTAKHLDTHLSISGGSQNTRFLLSMGYTRNTFNYPGDFADQRLSLHSSFSATSSDNRASVEFGVDYSYDQNNTTGGIGISSTLINIAPDFPGFEDKYGNLLWSYSGIAYSRLLPGLFIANPLSGIRQPFNLQNYNLNDHLHLSYVLLKGLSIGGTIGYSRFDSKQYAARPISSQDPTNSFGNAGIAVFAQGVQEALDIEPQLNYSRALGKGRLSVLFGGTYMKNITSQQSFQGIGFINDALLYSILAASTKEFLSYNSLTTKYVAGFGRINFIWADKYIFNLTANRDGSSLFGPGHRWGNFYSVGGGWIINEEPWFKKAKLLHIISYAKLSANYGLTGSNNVGPYLYQPNWTVTAGSFQGSGMYNPVNPLAPTFHWSTNKELGGHFAMGLFKDKIVVDLGAYRNRCGDQLMDYNLPTQTGFPTVTLNAPYTVQNEGWELSLTPNLNNAYTRALRGFSFIPPNFHISRNSNKILTSVANSPYAGIYLQGQPVTAQAFVKYSRVDPATGLFQYLDARGKSVSIPNTFSAFNPDTTQRGDANQIINMKPVFNYGFSSGFNINRLVVNFSLQITVQKGYNYLYDVYNSAVPGTSNFNQPALILDKEWKKPGDQATIQKFLTGVGSSTSDIRTGESFAYSTGAVSDASYIRLNNLSLNYSLSPAFLTKAHLQRGSINVRCQNLFTLTRYKVGDPETQSIYNIPPQRTIAAGINLGF